HGDFMVKARYENDIEMYITGGYQNGIRYEGTEGWIFVSRGNYQATASDPVAAEESSKALDASDPAILKSKIGENEIQLYRSDEQHGDWLNSIQTRKDPVSSVEPGHRACSTCLISHIAMKVPGKLKYDPKKEEFTNSAEANTMLDRPDRAPYGLEHMNL
ncbi:MAG: gfo/Idh/MocA family oxidoreductase, partial [Bacteroidales bacterium]|nr:gfo/Idh/MocA family oxidoreductase [Bacteroidales bacterium]